jgi:hypothetical protein
MTTKDETYNGWTNYETWAVKLWLDNDEGSYNYWRERSVEVLQTSEASDILTKEQRARYDLADELKREHEENTPEFPTSVYSDLLNAALSTVNWSEIAKALLDDAEEEVIRNA